MPSQRSYPQFDSSGAVQNATSHLLKKTNEVSSAKNAVFNEIIGSVTRRKGYEQVGATIEPGNDSLFGGVYRYGQNNKIITGVNNTADTAACLRYLDTGGYWTDILTDAAVNTRFNCINSLDEFYVAGISDNQTRYPLTLVDSTLSTTRAYNVLNAPKCSYVAEFQGSIFAIGCEVNGVKYPNRAYESSPPLSFITSVQTTQKGLLTQLRVDSIRYLKPGMQVDIYGAQTNAKKVTGLTIVSAITSQVDNTQRITFAPTQLDLADNDELWLINRKGKLTRFWNTDYPNTEAADFIEIPVSEDSETVPELIGYGKNNGRLFLPTPDSMHKFDGANLTLISENVGCVAPESIKNIGKWTLWFHSTGVWGYNDDTGQLQLLSKAVDRYIKATKSSNWKTISAVTIGRVYKISLGELQDLNYETTSTSTSSTSTSSTSSSTSSTSTSSTSTSSTSTSTSQTTFTTSTSSTSQSTSSTSTSFSTTSTSFSTSSTSTSTIASTKEVFRLCYDFDSNSWTVETHKREHRFQFRHRMHGYKKPYFTDETGRLFRDETGNLDNVDTIPFEVEWGRDNFATELTKSYHSVITDADRTESCVLHYSVNGGQFQNLGQLTDKVQSFGFPFGTSGYDINYKYTHNDNGPGPIINGQQTFWSRLQGSGASG